ncbi:MAG: tetratricopeptide repeat protein [Candidatus Krumholzibacteria bacterium]|nr:tetratricopeptide repeat protein [Candidatus Krumholzibacteria bacterium]
MNLRATRIARACAVAALVAAASMQSCAYFNTLYNARRIYREAEKASETEGAAREQREKYKEVVKKCAQMVQDYPKSRWIDDAMFLMGTALVKQEEYDKAIRKFQEILTNFPQSDYVPRSIYWLALAYHLKKDDAQALVYADRFLKEYPRHELRFDALFLGGDVKRALEDYEGALAYYGIVAAEAKKKEIVDESRLKSAELFRGRGDWEKAAESYRRVLRKGIPWERRYEISLALGECLAKTGGCVEALALFDGLLAKATANLEIPPLLLGRAASYECMDSLPRALVAYREVGAKYPKSTYSAEAYYRIGIIYQERLDSLRLAADAFAKVGNEYANSDFAPVSLERSSSIKRLLDLQKSAGKGESAAQAAEKRFIAAEIQLTRLEDIPMALAGYTAILDSFPETPVAPKAAYAIAWINQNRLREKETAIERYRALIERYPRSYQAKGALYQLSLVGADSLRAYLQAYRDSALADTTAALKADTTAASKTAPVDTAAASRPALVDTTAASKFSPAAPAPPDTLGGARAEPGALPVPAPVDTLNPAKQGGVG